MPGLIISIIAIASATWIVRAARSHHASARARHRRPDSQPSPRSSAPQTDDDDTFDVGRSFFCDTARSSNGRYLVGANSGHTDERGRKHRGACALKDLHTGTLCFTHTVTRGNNPHVSNDGHVIVEDWKDDTLSGALISFARDGTLLWAKHFKANILTSGLAADGHRAFVSTCNSDHEPHSGRLFLLDATSGDVSWTREGWGDVDFDGNVLVAHLTDVDGSKHSFAFDETGGLSPEYVEASDRIQGEKQRGQYWAVLPKVQAALAGGNPDISAAKVLLTELDGKDADMPEASLARLLRFRGEIAEREGDVARALDLWRHALSLDPKVGIRRRYDSLSRDRR